ncbi:MAG: hypothetical protein ABI334_08760 [Candidatus Dormiibacterota bacterium]
MKELKSKLAAYLVGLVVAFTLALAATVGLGAAPSHAVGACGWYPEGTKNTYVYNGNAHLFLLVYNDGCGHRKYEAQIQNTGVIGIVGTLEFRVWVCGSFVDSGFLNYYVPNAGNVATLWSSSYSYPWYCGAQADNYNTTVQFDSQHHYDASNNGTYLNF